MTWLYSTAILIGSCLLFLVQPMGAKMLLPVLGGTPAVWNTCMVFFQAGLLAGYAYAHAGPRWLGIRGHAVLHLALLLVAFFLLPMRLPDDVADGWHPIVWLLVSLTTAIGLPFLLLSAGAPLLQMWYSARMPSAKDPYFLYAASNIGSFLALVLFPFVLEPNLPLQMQGDVWRWAFLGCIALTAICVPWRSAIALVATALTPSPSWRERGRWIMLALIPSSLLLSVTTHLTTDIAAIPLLWLIPMALYLASFVFVFASRRVVPHAVFVRWLPLVVIVMVLVFLAEAVEPMPVVMAVHLVGFFWLATTCHGELARTRPAVEHLTDFYLCLAVGGVLGGTLNALIAPLIFPVLVEYPLMIALVCLFALDRALYPTPRDWIWVGVIGGLAMILIIAGQWLRIEPGPISVAVMFGLPIIAAYMSHAHPARFALSVAAILLASGLYHGVQGASTHRERSYFGIHRVTERDGFRRLIHGHTVHGQEDIKSPRPHLPLTYYSREGPIGDLFLSLKDDRRLKSVGLVGLGTGSLAYYADRGQEWTFFEIDPSVQRIAANPALFTFLADSQGTSRIELGDARIQLAKSSHRFGVLVVDAFGSDAIPLHLLTREALGVYLDRLAPDGILTFHISNNYVDLEPVLAKLAEDAKCVAYVNRHEPTKDESKRGIMSSHWLVIARDVEHLQPILRSARWQPARANPRLRVWTDDFSNLWQVFKW